MDAPMKTVSTKAANGVTPLAFYPHDIKALASLLWAKVSYATYSIGGRCDSKSPKKDENGRIIEPQCFDDNPATWHLVVTNRLGRQKKSFVMDATFDYEVWNQPVFSYAYSYFNPQTGEETETLSKAVIELAEYTKDKFGKYRSPAARYVVGVAMDVSYIVESNPSQCEDEKSLQRTVRYMYDLELSDTKDIIGGEWYTNNHPDFVWTPADGAFLNSAGESYATGTWAVSGPLPATWQEGAKVSSVEGQPLAKIVKTLVTRSR
jgi:hypothetical protein